MAKANKKGGKRHVIQLFFACITNSFVTGFIGGKIYQGKLKYICHPGLNCYSCPGALLSCPIGSLQAVLGSRSFVFSTYVFGMILLFGALLGRIVCGFLCPFGFVQELLYKIPFKKKIKTFKGDKPLRKVKYIVLVVMVIALPMLLKTSGDSSPTYCKYICPAGTLEAGIPHVAHDKLAKPPTMVNALPEGSLPAVNLIKGGAALSQPKLKTGAMFLWKVSILVAVLLLSIIIYRPFCKYLCPLGAIYGIMNPVALYRLNFNKDKCISCGICAKRCNMGVDPTKNANSAECVRCRDCVNACPKGALSTSFSLDSLVCKSAERKGI